MNGPQSQNRTDVMFNFLALSSIHFTCSEFKVMLMTSEVNCTTVAF